VDDSYLNFHSFLGWMVATANTANALVAAFCLVLVVRPGALVRGRVTVDQASALGAASRAREHSPALGLPRRPPHPAPLRGAALPCALLHGGRATQRQSSRRGRRAGGRPLARGARAGRRTRRRAGGPREEVPGLCRDAVPAAPRGRVRAVLLPALVRLVRARKAAPRTLRGGWAGRLVCGRHRRPSVHAAPGCVASQRLCDGGAAGLRAHAQGLQRVKRGSTAGQG